MHRFGVSGPVANRLGDAFGCLGDGQVIVVQFRRILVAGGSEREVVVIDQTVGRAWIGANVPIAAGRIYRIAVMDDA